MRGKAYTFREHSLAGNLAQHLRYHPKASRCHEINGHNRVLPGELNPSPLVPLPGSGDEETSALSLFSVCASYRHATRRLGNIVEGMTDT